MQRLYVLRKKLTKYQIEVAGKLKIFFPSILPILDAAPNQIKLKEWVEKHHDEKMRKIAQKIANHINYIPFSTFLEQLQKTVSRFNKYIKDRDYILWISGSRSKITMGCSNQWVAGLALEYANLPFPKAIAYGADVADDSNDPCHINSVLQKYSSITDILVLDDAAYTGQQIKNAIDYALPPFARKDPKYTLTIALPFMTELSKTWIQGIKMQCNINMLEHCIFPTIQCFFE